MGALFSRRRAQFAPAHMLESIEKRIDALDAKRRQIAAADQSTSNNIIAAFGVALALLAIYMLVIFRPLDALRIVQLIIILLVACIPLFLVQHLVHYFYQRKLAWNECALEQARKQRTDVLDRIKETETYKVANDLLEKFDPAIKSAKAAAIARETEERERETSRQAAIAQQQLIRQQQQQLRPATSPIVPVVEQQQQVQLESTMAAARLRIPRPVLQQVRTPVDKMVDFILGDGPNYRYALICVHCHCHNGLALAEQFEYLSFRCGYCFTFNHAPKQQQQSQHRSSINDHRAILPSTDDNNIETSSLSRHNSINSEHNESGSDIIVAHQSAAEIVTTTSPNDGMSTNNDCDESVQDPVPSIPQS